MRHSSISYSFSKISLLTITTFLSGLIGMQLTTGCTTSAKELLLEAQYKSKKVHPAAYGADGMILDNRMPEPRPYRKYDFFYKHCIVSRDSFPGADEWDCNDPF